MAEGNNGLSFKMILLLMFVIIIVTGLFSYFFMTFLFPENNQEAVSDEIQSEEIGDTYNLGEFTVNLSEMRSYQFIKASIVVEVDKKEVIDELERRSPQIQDAIILTLRELNTDDLQDADEIKGRLKTRINPLLNEGEIVNVWFTQFIVQ
ncbi:MAG: flagellar basal body-associated FliL family protein [Bacillota bacterium]